MLGDTEIAAPSPSVSRAAELPAPVTEAAVGPVVVSSAGGGWPASLVNIDRVLTIRQLAKARTIQTIFVALITAGLGYLIFEDKFVGTPNDLGAIFMWAFTIDLSVEALLQTARAAKRTP